MYTAEIKNKALSNGRLSVNVLFEDENGNRLFETFETAHFQDISWIGEQIKNKLSHLNSLPNVFEKIEVGPFNEIIPVKTEKDVYLEKAELYTKYMNIARLGFIKSDRKIILELREWLRDNFKDEYVDLF